MSNTTQGWFHCVLIACCVTDEIFGVSIARLGYVQTTMMPLLGTVALIVGIVAAWQRLGGRHLLRHRVSDG